MGLSWKEGGPTACWLCQGSGTGRSGTAVGRTVLLWGQAISGGTPEHWGQLVPWARAELWGQSLWWRREMEVGDAAVALPGGQSLACHLLLL